MKYRHKSYSKRSPYCRKKGGPAFRFKGGRKSPKATANFLGAKAMPNKMGVIDMVKAKLQSMGFRVGAR